MGRREPLYIKPRLALSFCLVLGLWSSTGAVAMGELSFAPFGAILVAAGALIYGVDLVACRLALGVARPLDVLRRDVAFAGVASAVGLVAGLAAPLYV